MRIIRVVTGYAGEAPILLFLADLEAVMNRKDDTVGTSDNWNRVLLTFGLSKWDINEVDKEHNGR